MKRFLMWVGAFLTASVLFGVYTSDFVFSRSTPAKASDLSQQVSVSDIVLDNNMEVVLSEDVVCAGEEVTVQMFTRVLNASPGIQFRNIEIYNSDLDPSIDIRETLFVEESDLNENGYLDWLDLDGEDYVAPNGDLRSDEEFLHEYSRIFTETTTIVAGDKADIFLLSDLSDPDSATDLDVTVEAEDSATITVFNPELSIQIEPASRRTVVGEPTEFNVTIVNTGDIDLTGVEVTHEEASGCDGVLQVISVGEEYEYTCQLNEAGQRTTLTVAVNSFAGDQLCTVDASERAVVSAVQPTAAPTNTSAPTATPEPTSTTPPTNTSVPPTATATTVPPTATATPTATAPPEPSPTSIPLTINGCDEPITSSQAIFNGTGAPNTQARLYVNSIDFASLQIGATGEWVYGVEFSSPGQYDVYLQSFNDSGAVTGVSSPVRCVVPEPEKPQKLPSTGSALMRGSATIWATLLIGLFVGLMALYDRRKREA